MGKERETADGYGSLGGMKKYLCDVIGRVDMANVMLSDLNSHLSEYHIRTGKEESEMDMEKAKKRLRHLFDRYMRGGKSAVESSLSRLPIEELAAISKAILENFESMREFYFDSVHEPI